MILHVEELGEIYNPCSLEKTEHEEPNFTNVEVGDVYLHRELCGNIIPFSVKKTSPNSFSAERIKKEPGLTLAFRLYEDAVILKKLKKDKTLLVGRNIKNIEDYVKFINSKPKIL